MTKRGRENQSSRPSQRHDTSPDLPAEGRETESDRVRRRAYEIYERRNGAPGDDLSDWLQAEEEFQQAPERDPAGQRPRKERAETSS